MSTPNGRPLSKNATTQDALGATHAAAFDLSAACSGFVYSLSVAANMLTAGAGHVALVIGAAVAINLVAAANLRLRTCGEYRSRIDCYIKGNGRAVAGRNSRCFRCQGMRQRKARLKQLLIRTMPIK